MGKKILLADDSITIQKVIELTFSDEDFDVVTVGNGRLALEKLDDVKPDIVLCDIIMPEKDGYEVCEHVKTSSAFSHVPVLLLTGAFEPFDQERAERVGSDGFLAKPFEPETLIAKVKELLSRAPAPQAAAGPPGDSGVTAPRPAAEIPPEAPSDTLAAKEVTSPPLEEVPPAVPPLATETTPPLGASLIPEEPFQAFDAGVPEETPAKEVTPPSEAEPLAPVSPAELATLTGETAVVPPAEGEAPPGESAPADSASTVMFNADQLPWKGETIPTAPSEAEAPPEPVLRPERPAGSDLAEETGAAFEEVLEEDLEFGGSSPADSPAGDTQVPMPREALPGEPAAFEAPSRSPFDTAAHPAPSGGEPGPAAEPPAPEVERFYEPSPPSEPPPRSEEAPPEPPPVFEAVPPSEPEAPPVFEAIPPASKEIPPVHEPGPTPEPEAPPVYEVAPASEPEAPPVFEAVPPAAPEESPAFLEGPPVEPEAPPVFETTQAPRRQPDTLPPLGSEAADAGPEPEPEVPYAPDTARVSGPSTPELEPPPTFEAAGSFPSEAEAPPEPAPEPGAGEAMAGRSEPRASEVPPGTGRSEVVESFADVETGGETEERPLSPSEAASVPVPVDMVEKIAQRVVAQVSDKVVREIAWEVIPDLAEALIKQEIERLKAELQKL